MGSVDQVDDRTFRANFSAEGVAKLRERVKDKLKEFMGDYTDDTLVEYVIVLLKNGRQKEEARTELNVFLGDDSDSFVSWLWDHLSASLDIYLHSKDSHVEEATKTKSTISRQKENDDSVELDSEFERGKSNKLFESRHKRLWRGSARDDTGPPPLVSSEVHNLHFEEKDDSGFRWERKSPSPQPHSHRKRSRVDDGQHEQRETNHDVPRRLLQFAVRDALATSNPSISAKEPSLKRLRSVVSTSTKGSSSADPPRRIRSVARVVNPMATVIKAVAEAAEDVRKTKPGRSVFDRISHSTDASEILYKHAEFREAMDEFEEYEEFNKHRNQIQSRYTHRRDYNGRYDDESITMPEIGLGANVISECDRFDDPSITGLEGLDVPCTSVSDVIKDDHPEKVQLSVAVQADDFRRIARNNYLNQPMEAATRLKIVNVSGNISPWKPPNDEQREVVAVDSQKSIQKSKVGANEAIVRSMKENNSPFAIGNGNVKPAADVQTQAPKMHIPGPGTYSAIRPLEDAYSRTIFVSNVHFGASKDSLSRHFNKFGEVLKVVILTDPATGQPTGSAYVEFMRKEAADNALSLDGTSFMSRILKIVKSSSAEQEAAPTMTWSRATRGTLYSVARFPRAPFPRGGVVTGAFRGGRPSVRPGARSLQWKRNAPATPADAAAASSSGSGNSTSTSGGRSLTYVRTAVNPSATT